MDSMSLSGRFGCEAEPGPPSMWSNEDITAGRGSSTTPCPGIGSAENEVR